jgi:hypothetical protein
VKKRIRMSVVDLLIGARGAISRRNKIEEKTMILRIGVKGGQPA